MSTKQIDIRLERDPRYLAAKERLTELQIELLSIDRQRNDVLTDINANENYTKNKIEEEALALLSKGTAPKTSDRETMINMLEELTHRFRVLSAAVELQKRAVADLRSEVGKAIAIDMLPQHKANVAAVIKAVFQLNAAMEAEANLRTALYDNDVPYSSYIIPMPFPGFGLLRDPNSRVSNFVIDCFSRDFITLAEVPDKLREWARAKKTGPVRATAPLGAGDPDGWGA